MCTTERYWMFMSLKPGNCVFVCLIKGQSVPYHIVISIVNLGRFERKAKQHSLEINTCSNIALVRIDKSMGSWKFDYICFFSYMKNTFLISCKMFECTPERTSRLQQFFHHILLSNLKLLLDFSTFRNRFI